MRLHERDTEAAGTVAGSAVAFRLFLFFVPMMLVVVALAGFAASWVSADSVSRQSGVSGMLAGQIKAAFTQPTTTRWTALLTGLFGMFSAGRSLSKTLVLASELSWRTPHRQKAAMRVTGMLVGMLVGLMLLAAIVNRIRQRAGIAVAGVSLIGVAIVCMVGWMALLMALPRATRDPGALLPGAALLGSLLAAMQAITQFYVPSKVSHASAIYGTLGVTVVTLGWFFIVGRMIVLSMTINAVIYERLGSISTFVFGLPVLRVLPTHSERFARFLGLPGRDSKSSATDADIGRDDEPSTDADRPNDLSDSGE
jgi:membrane protein